jgi:hypothetical protein
MDSARFNVFWFVSVLAPAAIMLFASLARRWWLTALAAALSVAATYWFCLIAVEQKWTIRYDLVQSDPELQRLYDSDGANQAFTAVVTGPIEAVGYTVLWGFLGWKFVSMYQARSSNKSLERTRER